MSLLLLRNSRERARNLAAAWELEERDYTCENSLRSWRDSRPSARALFMANGREREPRSREGIGASREGIGD